MSERTDIVIIGGCGHVGLPLGAVLATLTGHHVTLLDVDRTKIDLVNSGKMPFLERGMDEVLSRVVGKTLVAVDDTQCLRSADVVISVIGTPVDRHLNPLIRETYEHLDETLGLVSDGCLLILRSTMYPGTARLVYQRIKSLGREIDLAVCPERIAEGRAMEELTELPQIVSAFEPAALARASEFFLRLTGKVIEVEPLEAELGKLFVNGWRYLNFAVSNQFYMLCQQNNLDFYRIYEAFKDDYPRMASFPTAGLTAGPCLLKDMLQLCTFSNNHFQLGNAAVVVNESLPNFIVDQLGVASLKDRSVAVLGMAFKSDSDDRRDSLAYKLRNLLAVYARAVYCTDPYVADDSLVSLGEALERADVIVLGAPHSVYRNIELPAGKPVVDVWGFWPRPPVSSRRA